ncbi:MAG: glycosyltransferase, partial [Flavobacterium sp.]
MSFGLPVITANVGGPIELIENGKDGILVEADDSLQHVEAFMALFNDRELCKNLGENARKKVENSFSLAREKEELFGILK